MVMKLKVLHDETITTRLFVGFCKHTKYSGYLPEVGFKQRGDTVNVIDIS